MYKVFKGYYLWHGDRTEADFIQIVDCDLNITKELLFEGSCKVRDNKGIDIYSNSINCKAFSVAQVAEVEPLCYQELIDLIDLLKEDTTEVGGRRFSLLVRSWIDKLYSALLFYDDYIDYRFSKE